MMLVTGIERDLDNLDLEDVAYSDEEYEQDKVDAKYVKYWSSNDKLTFISILNTNSKDKYQLNELAI